MNVEAVATATNVDYEYPSALVRVGVVAGVIAAAGFSYLWYNSVQSGNTLQQSTPRLATTSSTTSTSASAVRRGTLSTRKRSKRPRTIKALMEQPILMETPTAKLPMRIHFDSTNLGLIDLIHDDSGVALGDADMALLSTSFNTEAWGSLVAGCRGISEELTDLANSIQIQVPRKRKNVTDRVEAAAYKKHIAACLKRKEQAWTRLTHLVATREARVAALMASGALPFIIEVLHSNTVCETFAIRRSLNILAYLARDTLFAQWLCHTGNYFDRCVRILQCLPHHLMFDDVLILIKRLTRVSRIPVKHLRFIHKACLERIECQETIGTVRSRARAIKYFSRTITPWLAPLHHNEHALPRLWALAMDVTSTEECLMFISLMALYQPLFKESGDEEMYTKEIAEEGMRLLDCCNDLSQADPTAKQLASQLAGFLSALALTEAEVLAPLVERFKGYLITTEVEGRSGFDILLTQLHVIQVSKLLSAAVQMEEVRQMLDPRAKAELEAVIASSF